MRIQLYEIINISISKMWIKKQILLDWSTIERRVFPYTTIRRNRVIRYSRIA